MKAGADSAILVAVTNREPGVALDELLASLQRKGVPLAFEIGTFVVLEVCEQVARAPARIVAADVRLDDEGQLAVARGAAASDADAAHALVELLGDLLVRSAPGVPPALLDLVEQGPSGGRWTLAALRDDLEASLVPLNRSATRRVLARIVREGRRGDERPSKRVSSPPSEGDVDAELDGVLGGAPADERGSGEREVGVVEALAPPEREPSRRVVRDVVGFDPQQAEPAGGGAGLDEFERITASERRPGALLGAVVALAAAIAVVLYLVLSR